MRKYEFTGTLEGSSADEDIKDVLKGFDFAWVIGASATLDDSGRDYDVQTNAFEMALGVGIPLVRTVEVE